MYTLKKRIMFILLYFMPWLDYILLLNSVTYFTNTLLDNCNRRQRQPKKIFIDYIPTCGYKYMFHEICDTYAIWFKYVYHLHIYSLNIYLLRHYWIICLPWVVFWQTREGQKDDEKFRNINFSFYTARDETLLHGYFKGHVYFYTKYII